MFARLALATGFITELAIPLIHPAARPHAV